MGQVIASIYEIEQKIGSGGGGIVYLGRHLRLDKKIVLKEDKRSLSGDQTVLRREVDALKNLSHTYIPQVYDFIEENGYVYTVMEYIEGESFDKPLKRGVRFSQVQVIEWACQLLEALRYLHSYPPHGILHADIKPSNIMLTPENQVKLIDFNIALALGEEGAIAVGRSFGYASPEHYGLEFSDNLTVMETKNEELTELMTDFGEKTECMNTAGNTLLTEAMSIVKPETGKSTSTSTRKMKTLDVRSDIYSLGATLYHILTGRKPAKNAIDVEPITDGFYSPMVVDIIKKAMHPDPDARFQTAEEMLDAFLHLRQNDPRTVQYKKLVKRTAILFGSLFLLGAGASFTGLQQMDLQKEALVLAEYSENALLSGDTEQAISYALESLKKGEGVLFGEGSSAQAQKALTDALRVYDRSDGYKVHGKVELPSAPLCLRISPEGKTAAVLCDETFMIFDIVSMETIFTAEAEPSALSDIQYLNEERIIYAGKEGVTVFDLKADAVIWTGKPATSISISADRTKIATIYKEETFANIYQADTGVLVQTVDFAGKKQAVTVNDSFANPEDNLFALNKDGSWLGVSFADGALGVYALQEGAEDVEIFDHTSGLTHFEGGFSDKYFAFSGTNAEESVFAVIDMEDFKQTGGFASDAPFGVQADESGIYIQTENLLVKINPVTGEQMPLVTTAEAIRKFAIEDTHTVISTKSGCGFYDKNANLITLNESLIEKGLLQIAGNYALVAAIDTPEVQILSLEDHADTQVFSYDPAYLHTEARISADGETIMLFSYDTFRLYSKDGNILKNVNIPDAEQIYDQQYRRDENGSYLEVIYNDGTHRLYSAADGSVMEEYKGEQPDLSLYEEFFTDTLRIEAPLHGTPVAYDKNSRKLVKELESEDYLTYVTQVGEYVITEYITAQGERYGLLLDKNCNTLAHLPGLCDVWQEGLIFDYQSGDLRKTRIYYINELKELAQE